jgi:hypothetical protein
MTSLEEYAKNNPKRSGPTPWRELNESNRAAWIEACEGIAKGSVSARRAAKWLIDDKGCPLMIDTIRVQLKDTLERYVKS